MEVYSINHRGVYCANTDSHTHTHTHTHLPKNLPRNMEEIITPAYFPEGCWDGRSVGGGEERRGRKMGGGQGVNWEAKRGIA